MPDPIITDNQGGLLAIGASLIGGGATLVLGIQKWMKSWASTGRDIKKIDAEAHVVELLRGEIARLNAVIVETHEAHTKEVKALRDSILEMREEHAKETTELRQEVAELRELNAQLITETAHWQGIVSSLDVTISRNTTS